jgi:signal transduction histidine kinase
LFEAEKKAFLILLIASFSLFIILVGFFLAILQQLKRNRILFEEKINAEMVGREEERKRISKDLHDDLGATITGAKMFLQGIQGKSDMDNLNISKAHASVSQCMILVRQIMNDLYPVSLDNYGLMTGISEFIEEINQIDKINILFSNNVNNLEAKIPKDHKIHLFRIIKEIIQNTIKHSNSKVLSIRFSETSNLIILDTVDEGIGFDGNSNSYLKKSHGIRNIINRVELIGGLLFLDARINKGVQYTIEIPVNATTKN